MRHWVWMQVFWLALPGISRAHLVFESATSGPTGQVVGVGNAVDSEAYLAVNFQVVERVIAGSVGAHLVADISTDPIFAAIVSLDGPSDHAMLEDLADPGIIGVTLIDMPLTSYNMAGNLRAVLDPGWYAVVLGSDRFGANGEGGTFNNNTPDGISQPYAIRVSDGAILPQAAGARVFVDTHPVPEFTLVADTSSVIPGSTQTITTFSSSASLRDGRVAFSAQGQFEPFARLVMGFQQGELEVLASSGETVPGGPGGNFNMFGQTAVLGAGGAVFTGGIFSVIEGIYTNADGVLQRVIDTKSPIPDGTGNFQMPTSDSVDIEGGTVTFAGRVGSPSQGIYKWSEGTVEVVADVSTEMPGEPGLLFDVFDDTFVPIDDGVVAFIGGNEQAGTYGVFHATETGIQRVFDNTEPLPGIDYDVIAGLRYRGGRHLLAAVPEDLSAIGIYTDASGRWEGVVASGDELPGDLGSLFGLIFPSFDGRHAAFSGFYGAGQTGLFSNLLGSLAPVLVAGDWALGKLVTQVQFGSHGLDGRTMAVGARFDDSTSALMLATYPPFAGDVDLDNDVDLADVSIFMNCFEGVGSTNGSDCANADVNGDRDVDLSDYATFAECASGPGTETPCAYWE